MSHVDARQRVGSDEMPWVRLDDSFADHPKIERVGPVAAWLHVAALCYCARHLTDGRLPKGKAHRLADVASPEIHVDALLRVGLWHEDGDDYVIHDYLDYQPARADVEADRAAARDRMAKKRQKRSPEVPANNGRSSPSPSRPDPLGISRRPSTGNSRPEAPPRLDDDEISTGDVPEKAWAHYADLKFTRQPPGKVSNAVAYKLTTAENARIELAEQATRWWHDYDITPQRLAECLIDGKAPSQQYRRKDSA